MSDAQHCVAREREMSGSVVPGEGLGRSRRVARYNAHVRGAVRRRQRCLQAEALLFSVGVERNELNLRRAAREWLRKPSVVRRAGLEGGELDGHRFMNAVVSAEEAVGCG